MANFFLNILVPIDFTESSEIAIAKAIALAGPNSVIHLFHVYQNLPSRIYTKENRLNRYRKMIEQNGKIKATTCVSFAHSVQSEIVKASQSVKADLIIIGKTSHHPWFPFLSPIDSTKITEQSSIPVLTAKPGSHGKKIKKIIVPITSDNIQAKLDVLASLNNKSRASVHLISFIQDGTTDDFQGAALMHAYQQATNKMHLKVEYSIIHGRNKARELLKFAQTIEADVLLLQAGHETTIGWPKKQISDMLLPNSAIQILAVQSKN